MIFKHPRIADIRLCWQSYWMTWKRLSLAALLGAFALPTGFYPMKVALTEWYLHTAPNDGLSGLGVLAGSLYFALACGLVTFGTVLSVRRHRP